MMGMEPARAGIVSSPRLAPDVERLVVCATHTCWKGSGNRIPPAIACELGGTREIPGGMEAERVAGLIFARPRREMVPTPPH